MDIDIDKFIPHRDRMKLIDEVVEVEDKKCVTSSIVTEEWPLFNDNSVNPIILIELVAQTTGIGVGWKKRNKTDLGGSGWLVGIKKADFSIDKIPLGSCLITCTKSLYDHENYGAFEGTVTLGNDILATIKIQVFSSLNGQT